MNPPSERRALENWDRSVLHIGPICLFYREAVLDEAIQWLGQHGYAIYTLDAARWTSASDFHEAIKKELRFPDYYGRNLNAMLDCLRDLEIPETGGVAIVVRRYDALQKMDRSFAQDVLDILADASYEHLVDGRRILALIQSDDPTIHFDPVGRRPVSFNPREWLNKSRGL